MKNLQINETARAPETTKTDHATGPRSPLTVQNFFF